MISNILKLLGWNSKIDIKNETTKPFVGVFCYTSQLDWILYAMYYLSRFNILSNKCILMDPNYFYGYMQMIYKKCNALPYDDNISSKELVEKVVDCLQKKQYKGCIISPKKFAENTKWLPDYFNIAKKMNWDIRVIGFDYEKKCAVIGPPHAPTTLQEIQPKLKKEMFTIVPYNLQYNDVSVRSFDSQKHGFVNVSNIILFLLIAFCISLFVYYLLKKS